MYVWAGQSGEKEVGAEIAEEQVRRSVESHCGPLGQDWQESGVSWNWLQATLHGGFRRETAKV